MKKIVSAFALVAIAAASMVALGIGTASATFSSISHTCSNITVDFTQFTVVPGVSSNATVTVNGTPHDFSWETGNVPNEPQHYRAVVPYVATGEDVEVVVEGTSAMGNTVKDYSLFSTENCEPPTTTTTAPPTTTTTAAPQVEPAVVVRPAAAVAVVAAPAFTG